MVIQDKVWLLKQTFRGRKDAYGENSGQKVEAPITDDVIRRHLKGQNRLGIYPLSPDIMDGSGTWWIAADIDDDIPEIAFELCEILQHLQMDCYLEKSKSKGYHVWVFFSKPVSARSARAVMLYACETLKNHTDYDVTELFPKQPSIKQNDGTFGYGNYINLPLFGKDVERGRTIFVSTDNLIPVENQWQLLKNIKKVTPGMLDEIIDANGIQVLCKKKEPTTKTHDAPPHSFNSYRTDKQLIQSMLPCVKKMMQGVSEGCRDVVAFTLAKHFNIERNTPIEKTEEILIDWDKQNRPPLGDKIIRQKVTSAYTGKSGKGYTGLGCEHELIQQFCEKDLCRVFNKQTTGNSKKYFRKKTFIPARLGEELMDEFDFMYTGGKLFIYNNGVFADNGEEFVRRVCRARLHEEARVNRINEVIAHISDLTATTTGTLNNYTTLINTRTGMLDWENNTVYSHAPSFKSTIQLPVEYNQDATCPKVDDFFLTTVPKDCIKIVEEFFGYCMIAETKLEKAFMLTGTGANGKSTFLNLLEAFIGENNVSKIPLQELDEHRFKRADLFGKLVNLFADLDERALESSTYFKTIVSGDAIDAERKNKDPFFFRPFAKLAFSANAIPRSPDKSYAYFRRWCIIPFGNIFSGKDADKHLIEKLTTERELSGLLNKAIRGLRRLYNQEAFSESKTTQASIVEYQKMNDTVSAFIQDKCLFTKDKRTERSKVYDEYTAYCENEGFKPVSRIACYNRIRAMQQVAEVVVDGIRLFDGIDIIDR